MYWFDKSYNMRKIRNWVTITQYFDRCFCLHQAWENGWRNMEKEGKVEGKEGNWAFFVAMVIGDFPRIFFDNGVNIHKACGDHSIFLAIPAMHLRRLTVDSRRCTTKSRRCTVVPTLQRVGWKCEENCDWKRSLLATGGRLGDLEAAMEERRNPNEGKQIEPIYIAD